MRSLLSQTFLLLPIICGCTPSLNLGARAETTVIHERLGQPSKVAQDEEILVTTTGEDGKPVNGRIRADGMMLLDRPTYEIYHEAWKKGREKVDVDVTPRKVEADQ
jgi:hypothetical protein